MVMDSANSAVNQVGEPEAENLQVRFDEQAGETVSRYRASARLY